jgi:hypothetical protein
MSLNKYLNQTYGTATKKFRDAGGYVLSPSGTGKFFNAPDEWIDDREGKINFDGNTQTVLGTLVHACIEAHCNEDEISYDEVEEWIEEKYIDNDKVDIDTILSQYQDIFEAWKISYSTMYPIPEEREIDVSLDFGESIRLAGKVDAYEPDRGVVIDWKTTDKKPSKLKKSHEIQIMMYALAMIAEGKEVNTIRVCYIQRPTKTIGPRIWVFDKEVTDEMLIEANYYLQLQISSLELYFTNKELRALLFRPNPLASWLN